MPNPLTVTFRDVNIPITHPKVSKKIAEKAIATPMFKTWLERCEKKPDNKKFINIKSVEIQSVDMFGPKRVGFIKLKSKAYLVFNGKEIPRPVPGIALLRGDSVGILVVLSCNGKKYTILVEQARIPIGDAACLEMPAGMIDDENVKYAAVKEMEEECGIKLKKSDLISLTPDKMLPSPGGCDEAIDLYYFEKKVTVKELKEMQGRIHGKKDEGEHIRLTVVPFEEASKKTGDSKLLCAMYLYGKAILNRNNVESLTVSFRGNDISITYPSVSKELAEKAIATPMFKTWLERCEKKPDNKKFINIKSVEIQSVDMFGP
eukprot:CAMPEP_0194159476 /NCGR_PEP_ID=MMETSP0152-20130528/77851_1 /TAXON_ID=1049557 /ORGANISM="Thalassiothrix antarctica, Strain L6-D1" /LENGTH=317 /DNA_ID=CAMNT_0038869045 /DNA_START=448 /DNA_END=1398 /DNA_ORIENTATION=-